MSPSVLSLVIAHRLTTVEKADRVVALDRGCVAETGTHRELLAFGGVYDKRYRIQFPPAEPVNSER